MTQRIDLKIDPYRTERVSLVRVQKAIESTLNCLMAAKQGSEQSKKEYVQADILSKLLIFHEGYEKGLDIAIEYLKDEFAEFIEE